MPNYLLTLSYDGTDFHGWQSQPSDRTVQDVLESALAKLFEPGIRATAAGRTDAGVHALCLPVNFHAARERDPDLVRRALSALLPYDVEVRSCRIVPGEFSARFSARSRIYRYRIETGRFRDPITRRFAWQIPIELDTDAMQNALPLLAGEHDFGSFRSAGCVAKSPVRTILRAELKRPEPRRWELGFEATGFLRGMVRAIVGTLVEVGLGRRPPQEIEDLLRLPDRARAGRSAPACGLFFTGARYGDSYSEVTECVWE
ncbi:MAG: tRNA pseudouridine(38-40) synthase TruA [Deltaproteobacteria bacterium]|nr:tRNA pseudouridine(38-40) synthase TruA [Deltaproteobacteria bacterium]